MNVFDRSTFLTGHHLHDRLLRPASNKSGLNKLKNGNENGHVPVSKTKESLYVT